MVVPELERQKSVQGGQECGLGFVHIRSFAHDLMMRSRGFIQEEYSALEQQLDEERGKLSPATKIEGCLKKKNRKHGILGSKWNKRWFVLENGILTYAKNKQEIVKGEIQVFSLHELEYVNQRKERQRNLNVEIDKFASKWQALKPKVSADITLQEAREA